MRQVHLATVLLAALAALPTEAQEAAKQPGAVRVVGRIVSVIGEGVPAAEVWATDKAGKQLGRTVADGDGYYQLHRLPTVPLQLHARAEGRVAGCMPVASSGLVRAATMVLEDARPLRGVVVRADGTPVAEASVVVCGESELPPPFAWFAETTTDATGAWSLPAAPLRPLWVRACFPGREIAELVVPCQQADAVRVQLPAGETKPRRVQVRGLPAGTTAVVRIEPGAAPGQPIRRLPRAVAQATVAADGTATLWSLPTKHEVRIAAPGHASYPVYIPCDANSAADLEFTLRPAPADTIAPQTRVTGQLVDDLGAPLPGIVMLVRSGESYAEPVTTTADGTFALDVPARERVLYQLGLRAGAWRLGDPKAALDKDGQVWLTLSADGKERLRVAAVKGGALRGTLLAPKGTPLAAASVQITQLEQKARAPAQFVTATDPAGRLDVVGLPAGSYQLTATGDGACVGTVRVHVAAGEIAVPGALEFAAVGEVCGVVRDAKGAPMAGALFTLVENQGKMPAAVLRRARQLGVGSGPVVLTDREGRFRLPGVGAGSWSLAEIVPGGPGARVLSGDHPFTLGEGERVKLEIEAAR